MNDADPAPPGGTPDTASDPHGHDQQGLDRHVPHQQTGLPGYPDADRSGTVNYGQQPTGMPPLASWGWRVLAALIDGLITYVPDRALDYAVGGYTGSLLGATVAVAIWFGLAYMAGTTGQTPGKKAVGIHLLRESDGRFLGFGLAVARWFLHLLDTFPCGIGYLWPLWDDKRQTFADKIVHSVVIKP
jgi:uncharacterized RDD family membrane protein YckC